MKATKDSNSKRINKKSVKPTVLIISAIAIIAILLLVSGCSANATKENQARTIDKPKDAKQIGIEASKQGKWDQAINQLNKAVASNPTDINTRFQLANAYDNKSLTDDAIKQYQAILAIDKNNADAHYNIGRIYIKKNEIDKAIKEFETAIAGNPNFTSARIDLADAYTIKGDYNKALAAYDELAKILKTDTKFLSQRIYTPKARIYQAMGDHVKAKTQLEAAIKLDKTNTEAADILQKMNKP